MNDSDMLARLVSQAQMHKGAEGGDLVMIRALVEEASDLGAGRALERLGLADRGAEKDMAELRELLGAWRDAKKTARAAVIGWTVRGCLALMLIGMAMKLGLVDLMRGLGVKG